MIILSIFQNYVWWKVLIDTYLVWIIVLFLVKFILINNKFLNFAILFIILLLLNYASNRLGLVVSSKIFSYIVKWYPILLVVIMAPDIRRQLEFSWKKDSSRETVVMGSISTRDAIADAAFQLSSQKTGALITIEKHNTLDQFADRAIMMHSNISKELLLNIFIPNTPLHDGAVIIRGDEILCAGAYFILSEKEVEDKTMGSRHRAALGISEVTDSLTIVVSEETGDVSIAVEGILLKMNDRDKLIEYLSMFMR